MSELHIGLVGCGGIGGTHARSWAKVEGARIVAACDIDVARAEAVVASTGGRAYPNVHALLQSEKLDAIDICTPPGLHSEAALAALGRKVPTLCEKPLARNPDEAREIVDAAEEAGTLLMTAFCHRFQPDVEFVRGLIDDGTLGRVLMFRNRFGTRFAGIEDRWFSEVDVAGGGVLMDTSIHSVDLFRHLVGEVRSASAAVTTFNPAIRRLEDSAIMVLTAENGAIGVIEASWMTPWSANVVEIYGERGAAVISYDTGETKYRCEGAAAWTVAECGDRDRFVEELRHFAAVVRGEATPRVTGSDGLRAVEVIHQAYGQPLG